MKKIAFLLLFLPSILLAQFSIKGEFTPAKDYKWVILYKITPETSEYVTDMKLDDSGDFEISLDSTVTSGMYRVVYGLPQEEYNFDIIYNAKEDVVFNFNTETGVVFQSSIENKIMESYTYNMGLISQSIGAYYSQQEIDSVAIQQLFKTQIETQTEFEKAAKGTIAESFIRSNRPYIPKAYEEIETYINNLRIHFFKHVDFNDNTLQSSNFLIERVLNFVFGMSSNGLDENTNYIKNLEEVNLAMKNAEPIIKKQILQMVWQQFVDINNELIANHISSSYLYKLANSLNDNELINMLSSFERISIGNQAPDFSFEMNSEKGKITKKLSQLEGASKYLLVFWSSSCGHCLEEIPELHNYLKTNNEISLQVIAVGLEENSFKWRLETLKYDDFIHVLGLGKWDNEIGNNYNVTATPAYFVLNRDKKIIGKPLDLEALKTFLEDQK